ncbi:MAG: segregation/condensation protein A [Fibrobacteres bacterium]|jgi:chromatin segregation and condensation protein Rec8/ScpA/Scc1 (kleisin family)|nr:segregation/condensation protein A [Fibrobacterota bacterium]
MSLPSKQIIETEYEVKLGVFEGPLDLLLYLVQKNELDPRQIQISVITDQYLAYMDGIKEMNLSNAGEFLVMAARLMRLKARELLPADQKDELEEMEYELDRQMLIQQMLEYQKFKEAARVLRNHESRHFGAYGRGRPETADEKSEAELEEEAGVFDLMSAFRSVVLQKPKLPVHEVEIDDVTIEDRMQEVEIALTERGRSLFEDLFANDTRTISLVVTFMAILELAKLDRILFRQSRAMGPIWVYRKQKAADYELELKHDESMLDTLPEFKPGLVGIVQEQIKQRAVKNALEEALRDLENGILPGDAKPSEAAGAETAGPEAAVAEGANGNDIPSEAANGEAGPLETASGETGDATLAATAKAPMDSRPASEPDAPDPIADAALRDLMKRMREASSGEVTSDIPEDED